MHKINKIHHLIFLNEIILNPGKRYMFKGDDGTTQLYTTSTERYNKDDSVCVLYNALDGVYANLELARLITEGTGDETTEGRGDGKEKDDIQEKIEEMQKWVIYLWDLISGQKGECMEFPYSEWVETKKREKGGWVRHYKTKRGAMLNLIRTNVRLVEELLLPSERRDLVPFVNRWSSYLFYISKDL